MSARIDKSWTIIASHHTDEVDRCVDVFSRPDGSFGFEEFRKEPEDMGGMDSDGILLGGVLCHRRRGPGAGEAPCRMAQ